MTHTASDDISQRLADIETRALAAAQSVGGGKPQLVAVSKMQSEPRIVAALDAGQRVFGENRVQEAQTRWAGRRRSYDDLVLHLVGPLQTNKAEAAIALFDVIETLDRLKLARALAKAQDRVGRSVKFYIQVNTGEEAQKAGVLPSGLPGLLSEARELGLQVCGLMCIPPVAEPAGAHFAFLARLAERHGLGELSMGMSADYELAVRFGATHVRVGSGLFGARPSQSEASGAKV